MKRLEIQILTDKKSWAVPFSKQLKELLKKNGHKTELIHSESLIREGDILVIFGWYGIISKEKLSFHKNNIVIHPSALPRGKGCSPLTWQILEGKNKIPVTLFEAVEKIDGGDIYLQDYLYFQGNELLDELKKQQGEKTVKMVLSFIEQYPKVKKRKQKGKSTYYHRRKPEDSEIDINKTIKEQFNLLRVVDNERYPAFFRYRGRKYILKIYKNRKI